MSQNTSIYWKTPETAERARWMAQAEDVSVSQFLSAIVNERWEQLNPEPPIQARCPTCGQETTFVFVAYWQEQSDLYRCSNCQKVIQKDSLNNGHKADEKAEKEAINE